MYSWGPTTTDWKNPKGYAFSSARAPYFDKLAAASSARGGRSYSARTSPDDSIAGTLNKTISSDSKNPVVVLIDGTGSMASWPAEIFDRLPLLYQTLSQYREDLEVSFGVIGDAYCDQYPIQICDFAKGVALEDKLNALYPEGCGGGQISESYELSGYFLSEKCRIPNATSPFLIIFGDEKFYEKVNPAQVEAYIGDHLQSPVDSAAMWKDLMQKFNVFYLHKPYGSGSDPITREVREYWGKVLGLERVIELPSSDRAVDVAIGLIAKQWGEYKNFTGSMSARHDDDDVKSVHHSLRFIPDHPATTSVTTSKKSTSTKPLAGPSAS